MRNLIRQRKKNSIRCTEALLNHETAIFFFYFFFSNTETHKETNSADVGPVENFVASAKRVGSVSSRGCLDAQSGYKFKSRFKFLVFHFAASQFSNAPLYRYANKEAF